MLRVACIAASVALMFGADVPKVSRAQPVSTHSEVLSDQTVSLYPDLAGASGDGSSASPSKAANQPTADNPSASQQSSASGPLQEESRMQILRFVDGEFGRLVTPLPGSKKGFHSKAGQPLDQNALRRAIRASGASLNAGDTVQITKLDFLPRGILVELNGGGNSHKSWRDHLQMSVGIPVPMQTSTTRDDTRVPAAATQHSGATFFLDFNTPLPNMTPNQVKQYLGVILDFSKQRSAAINWTDSLPPQMQDAIRDKRAIVGMDHEEVLAALGRADRKVRERDADGNDTEDWIYGHPPSPTTFVRFIGDKVSQIDQYPR